MRKFLTILISNLLLFGCSNQVNEISNDNINQEPQIMDVSVALSEIGYEIVGDYCVKYIEDQGTEFLYVFSMPSGEFQMIELPTLRTYSENVRIDRNNYINTIMNEELVQAKVTSDLFGNENTTIELDVNSYLKEYTMQNLHQVFLKNGYHEENGFYVKHFDNYSLAINVKGRAITLYKDLAYYRYLSDHSGKSYSLKEGYCTYNSFTNQRDNCYDLDVDRITYNYETFVKPELQQMNLQLYDLDIYYDAMMKLKWDNVRFFEPDRFPTFNRDIYTPDPDSKAYVLGMFERKGAKLSNYTIEISYKDTKGIFYYEDKTFTLANSDALYSFGLDKGFFNGCYYDFESSKGDCGTQAVKELKELKNTMYRILDSVGLNINELHLCFNVTDKFDKNIPNEVRN